MSDHADEVNPNEIIARMATDFAMQSVASISKLARKTSLTILPPTPQTFERYIRTSLESIVRVKTLFFRDAEPLWNFYIPASLYFRGSRIPKANIEKVASQGNRAVIFGTAGSGKSILMRHLFLDIVRSKKRVPIYIELRNYNTYPGSFKEFVNATLAASGLDLDKERAQYAVDAGLFVFLLDALDEVDPSRRNALDAEIRDLAIRWINNLFILSSRPDHGVEHWSSFDTYRIGELTKPDAVTLIQKTPFDAGAKRRFIELLESRLFESRKEFCSNPLLLSIMLLTFELGADIPSKQTAFFDQAYEALYSRHDAGKEGFARRKQTGLDLREFERAFAVFSAAAYDRRTFTFTRSEAYEFADKARAASRHTFSNEDFLEDLQRATCLLVEDGTYLSYTHRSFQEYFVAKLISWQSAPRASRLIRACAKSLSQDNVIRLLHELNPAMVESSLLLPHLDELANAIAAEGGRIKVSNFQSFIIWTYDSLATTIEGVQSLGIKEERTASHEIMHFILSRYDSAGLTPELPDLVDDDELRDYLSSLDLPILSPTDVSSHPPLLAWLCHYLDITMNDLQVLLDARESMRQSIRQEEATMDSLFDDLA